MSHFLIIICLLIIFVTKQSVYGSTHAVVGNYSELNPKDCGITRFQPNLDYSCFKWSNNILGGMKGRNATVDEVPWIIYLARGTSSNQWCTGSFIGDQWVVTAAHCVKNDDPELYYIYAGIDSFNDPSKKYLARAKLIIKHPDYPTGYKKLNDIALIKLDRLITSIKPIEGSEPLSRFKSICLPQKYVFNAKKEFAMSGGWGQVNRDQWPLQVGIRFIYPSDDYSFVLTSYYIVAINLDNKTLMCKGDSGGPLWQYDSGRAVLIGVASTSAIDNSTKCQPDSRRTASWFVKFSKYIDWIKNVTQLN